MWIANNCSAPTQYLFCGPLFCLITLNWCRKVLHVLVTFQTLTEDAGDGFLDFMLRICSLLLILLVGINLIAFVHPLS